MKDLQTILAGLERDRKSGKAIPTAQLVEEFRSACPLGREEMATLAQCINECTEQLYEQYRALIDLFRQETTHTTPDAATIRLAIALQMLDDEVWLPRAQEQEG